MFLFKKQNFLLTKLDVELLSLIKDLFSNSFSKDGSIVFLWENIVVFENKLFEWRNKLIQFHFNSKLFILNKLIKFKFKNNNRKKKILENDVLIFAWESIHVDFKNN